MKTDLSQLLGIICISGSEAKTFIQNQFSNDVDLVNTTNSQISSYNSPKGRVYAIFRIMQVADDYYLITSKDQINFLVKRLSMFVLRSDVKITDISDQYRIGTLDTEALEALNLTVPQHINQVVQEQDSFIISTPGIDSNVRYLLVTEESNITLDDDALQREAWLLNEIQAGIPHIFAGAEEQFVAQMLNLDLIDGINFQKGCYPGQEIIARMKYLGTLKKRLFEIALPIKAEVQNGQAIYQSDSEQSIGQLVYAANDGKQQHALAVLNLQAVETGKELHLKQDDESLIVSVVQSFTAES